jgi:primosomal protein N' (replication factor Y)
VLLHTPAYSQVGLALSYLSAIALAPGTLVRVPLAQRELLGVVWDAAPDAAPGALSGGNEVDPAKLRPIAGVLDALPALSASWRKLIDFAAGLLPALRRRSRPGGAATPTA